MADKLIEIHEARLKGLMTDRSQWDSQWQDVVDYVMAFRSDVTRTASAGAKKTQLMYDSHPTRCLNRMAASLATLLTSTTSTWHRIQTRANELMKPYAHKLWFEEANLIQHEEVNRSNFPNRVHEFYLDLGGFGTSPIFTGWSQKLDGLNYVVCPIHELYIAENAEGYVDTIYRVYERSVQQLADEHGEEALSKDSRKALKENHPDTKVEMCFVVTPRRSWDPARKDAQNQPYAGLYYERKALHQVEETGFAWCPWSVCRWSKNSKEVNGRSPSIDNMADIKTLHQQRKTNLRSGQKAADPPMNAPANMRGRVVLTPAGVNYYKAGSKDRVETLDVSGNLPVSLEMMQDSRQMISEAYFNDVLAIIQERVRRSRQPATAEEIRELGGERLMILGPVLTRILDEALSPAMLQSFQLLYRHGKFPPPPARLAAVIEQGLMKMECISPLAKAMRSMELRSAQEALSFSAPFLQIEPAAAVRVNVDKLIQRSWEITGAPTDMLRSDDEVATIRAAEERQRKADQALAATQAMLDAGKTAADIQQTIGGQGAAPQGVPGL